MKCVENRFLSFIGLSFTTLLLSAFLLTCFGVIDFKIISEIKYHLSIEYFLDFIMFMINMFFLFSVVTKVFDHNIYYILLGYFPLYLIGMILKMGQSLLFSTIVPVIYILIIVFVKYTKNIGWSLTRTGIFTLIIGIYQLLSGYIKLSGFGLKYYQCNSFVLFLYSIDLYLVYILLYCVVRKYNGHFRVFRKRTGELSVSEQKESSKVDCQFGDERVDISNLNIRQKFLFWCLITGYQLAQLAIVFLIGYINNRFIELCIMLIVFWGGKAILKKCWHGDVLWICSVVTFTSFYILTKVTPPLPISLFSCIVLSSLFVYILYKIGIYTNNYDMMLSDKVSKEEFKNKSRRNRAAIILIDLDINHSDYNLLSDYANGQCLYMLSDKYNMSESTINRKINALTRK